ncbi:hypothetical protein [Brevibacillus laterosporus]|uniref:hypothetical protein n=1 Tax=Brevibacillus laterosporus TaxID=1465 RepID=UPI0018CF7D3C|nr:hypothetical protein [Brevibacillus laterosporus]
MAKEPRKPSAYLKAQIVQSKRYTPVEKDVITAILDDEKRYTHDEVAIIIQEFRGEEVS